MSAPSPVRLGAVGYLNARPLVCGLEDDRRFSIRYDVPSECARLLHAGAIDVGLIPSIEYIADEPYYIVPDLAIASSGPVASVALFTTRPLSDVKSIALDTSSRTSIALLRVLCKQLFKIGPAFEPHVPDLARMLRHSDAALIIGDTALFVDESEAGWERTERAGDRRTVQKIDLGDAWTKMTGLPFVYAFWAGRREALEAEDVEALIRARDDGLGRLEALAREYLADQPERQQAGVDYLRDNIKYHLGSGEQAGLEAFYRYAAEAGVSSKVENLRFFEGVPARPTRAAAPRLAV